MKNVKNILGHLVHYWEKEHPAKAKALAPPASNDDIQSLQRIIGTNLPREYVELLKLHNGYKPGVPDGHRFEVGFFHYSEWEFSPTSDVIKSYKSLGDLAEEFNYLNAKNDKVEKGIRPVHWDKKWLPIFVDTVGNSLCLDFNPTNEGTKGQLIYVEYGERYGKHKVVASNFLDGFAKIASGLVGDIDSQLPEKKPEIAARQSTQKIDSPAQKKPGWLSWTKPKEK